jgi:hypothetical protein
MADQLDRIRAKVALLRQLDAPTGVWHSEKHQYALHPCLTEAGLHEIEEQHQIRLPDGYRRFLLEMGNGGAGPHYGMFSLEFSVHGIPYGWLQQPFPYERAYHPARDPQPEGEEEPLRKVTPDLRERMDNDFERLVAAQVQPRLNPGYVDIAHQGCGMYDLLIVTGPERGHIWMSDWGNGGGIYPVTQFAQIQSNATSQGRERISFLDWYESWLDVSLGEITVDR